MKVDWFAGTKAEHKETRRKEVESYKNAFEDLKSILEGWEESGGKTDYDCPSWSHKQADRNGANRMLRKVINLISITKD